MVAHSKERLLREARRRGLLEPEEITAMQGLAEVGRGALGEFADVARSGIGAGIETIAEDVAPSIGRGLAMAAGGMGATEETIDPNIQEETFGDRYEDYRRMANAEREYVAQANPELSSTLRNVGAGLGLVAGGGVVGKVAAPAVMGLTRATKAALSKGASKVKGGGAKPRVRYRGDEVVGVSGGAKAGGRLSGVKEGAALGVVMDASDGDISLGSAATSAAGGALGGKVIGGILGKLGISGAQAEAIKGAAINTPIGRMGISQLAKKFGLSGTKAAALWYALHPSSRRGLSKLRDSLKGK